MACIHSLIYNLHFSMATERQVGCSMVRGPVVSHRGDYSKIWINLKIVCIFNCLEDTLMKPPDYVATLLHGYITNLKGLSYAL